MARNITITFEDGTQHQYAAVPDSVTPEQVHDRAIQEFGKPITNIDGGNAQPTDQPKQSLVERFKAGLANAGAGALQGAGNIGATILSPLDATGITGMTSAQRRAGITSGLQSMGADTQSIPFKGGELAAEIAGTAGAGGLIGRGVGMIAPKLGEAIASGGFSTGSPAAAQALTKEGLINAATRVGGGTIAGGGSAAMVNPSDTATGSAIGAALPIVGKVLSVAAPNILGMTTGAGAEPIKQAFQAGKKGGTTQDLFTANMRGDVPKTDVLNAIQDNINAMGAAKQAEYKAGMANVANDKTVLSFNGIDKAVQDAGNIVTFKGVTKNQKAADIVGKIQQDIADWKALKPTDYHTPEGLDALKQKIGAIVESIPYEEKTARMVAGNVYNAIKGEITQQAPTYAKTMADYSHASDLMNEIRQTLSQKPNASVDTQMRKLQSLMRNNVNTGYGNRMDLVNEMVNQGGNEVLPQIAGQAFNSITPRGLQSASTIPTALMAGSAGGVGAGLAALTLASPRLVGEASLAAGQLARKLPANNAITRALAYRAASK